MYYPSYLFILIMEGTMYNGEIPTCIDRYVPELAGMIPEYRPEKTFSHDSAGPQLSNHYHHIYTTHTRVNNYTQGI